MPQGGSATIAFFSSRRRHTRCLSDWSSDVCSSDLRLAGFVKPDSEGGAIDRDAGTRVAQQSLSPELAHVMGNDLARSADILCQQLVGERRHRHRAVLALGSDRKSTRLNSSHLGISYAVFCLKKKKKQ